jgi:hypothetical protein
MPHPVPHWTLGLLGMVAAAACSSSGDGNRAQTTPDAASDVAASGARSDGSIASGGSMGGSGGSRGSGGAGGGSQGGLQEAGTAGTAADGGPDGAIAGGADAGGATTDGATVDAAGCDCVETPPPGWSGPVLFALVASTAAQPSCPTGLPSRRALHEGLDVEPAACGCSCTTPGVFCGAFRIRTSNGSCAGGGTSAGLLAQGECITVSETGIFRLEAPAPNIVGTCSPQPTVSAPPVSWQGAAIACGGATEACAGGVCLPERAAPFDALCIHRDGDEPCPTSGRFTERSVVHGGADDTRGCSACTCGAASGSCLGRVDFRTGSCAGSIVGTAMPGACTSGSISPSHAVIAGASSPGSCPPASVGPTGTITPAEPVTFCCEP